MKHISIYGSIFLAICLIAQTTSANQPATDPIPETLPSITPGKKISLTEALTLADRQNLSLSTSRTEVAKAEAQLKRSWSLLIPVASATITFTHNDHEDVADSIPGSPVIREQNDLSGNLLLSMPIIDIRNWQNISLQGAYLEAAEQSIELARQTILLSVAQAYYQALTARTLIGIHRNQIQSSKRHLAVATVRHRSGTGQRLDVIRAKTELLTAYEELINAHTGLDNTREALAVLLNINELPLPTELPDTQAPSNDENQLLQMAQRKREDIKLQKALVEVADSQLTFSKMQFLPNLYGQWKMNYTLNPSAIGSPDQARWFIGLNLSVPLYDHTRFVDLEIKRADLNKAMLEAQRTEIEAREDVRKARRDYLTAKALTDTGKTKAELALQSLQLAESAYENGTGSSLEVTDARRSSRTSDINLAVQRFLTQLSLLKLLRATGCDMRTIGQ